LVRVVPKYWKSAVIRNVASKTRVVYYFPLFHCIISAYIRAAPKPGTIGKYRK